MAEWQRTRLVGIGSSQEGQILMNPLHSDRLSAAERRTEVCAILAAGLLRLQARRSDGRSRHMPESSLPITQHQSGNANPNTRRTA